MAPHGLTTPQEIWSSWSWDPPVIAGLGAAAVLYAWAARRLGLGRRRKLAFYGGLLMIAAGLVSPLDSLSHTLLAAHMGQHLLLILAAPPALVYGMGKPALSRLVGPTVAWAFHAAALWTWHLPVPYQAALRNDALHAAEHAAFLITAYLFWGLVMDRRLGYGGAILLVFATALQSGALGAILTLASFRLYPLHGPGALAWGLTPLEDQQLAGAIMWIPSGGLYLLTMGILAWRAFGEMDARMPPADQAASRKELPLGGQS